MNRRITGFIIILGASLFIPTSLIAQTATGEDWEEKSLVDEFAASFAEMDSDNDSLLSPSEATPMVTAEVFAMGDTDDDDQLDYEEYIKLMRDIHATPNS